MSCYGPLRAWWGKTFHESGKRKLVFRVQDAYGPTEHMPIALPCGRCAGCKLERSRQWGVRCMHEASLYDENVFVTLTFSDEGLARRKSEDGTVWETVAVEDWQRFMKRLLKRTGKYAVRDENGKIVEPGIRFFACGEYGSEGERPHYHACLFNYRFEDAKPWKRSESGEMLFTSEFLEDLWPYGYSSLGAVTFQSAAYVARYALKKLGSDKTVSRIVICPVSGEVTQVAHEFGTQSRRPGIGSLWIERFGAHTRSNDFVVVNEKRCRPPTAYDRWNEESHPEEMALVKRQRRLSAKPWWYEDNSSGRMRVKELCQEARMSLYKPKL